jgi:hypothetical protein
MAYDNNMCGALWKNDNREKETHPQLKGSAEIDGVEYWVSGWTSKEGGKKPLVSLSFKRKDAQRAPRPTPGIDDLDPDVPF